jgi:hypothetical protein
MDTSQPPRCAPLIAQRLQQLYGDALRQFDQAYITTINRLRHSHGLGSGSSQPPQPQTQLHQPTDEDYQALLAIASESSFTTPQAMSILPRFAHRSCAELEARHVPQHVIAFVAQNRDHLQRVTQAQNGLHPALISQTPPKQQVLAPGQGRTNTLLPTQIFNNGVSQPVQPSTAQSMGISGIPSMGTQITGASSNGGPQGQGGEMSASLNPSGMVSRASNEPLTQFVGSVPIRRSTQAEIVYAQRWVEEQKRIAFSRG